MTSAPKEASKRGQYSWALFDWANQPFFTVITTFIFSQYFANVMIGDPIKGQAEWAFTQSTSGIIIAVLSPFLGAMADAGGRRKPYIFFFQCLVAIGCFTLGCFRIELTSDCPKSLFSSRLLVLSGFRAWGL